MNSVVLDANYLVAWLDPKDSLHRKANDIDDALGDRLERLVVDIAVSEALNVVARRCEEQKRSGEFLSLVDFFESYAPESRTTWISPLMREFYPESIKLLRRYSGRLNFNDALIALFMKHNNFLYLASFDTDFDLIPEIRRIASPADAAAIA
jgi:predicted nucleic acid-binding protein